MEMDDTATKISLVQEAFNPYHAAFSDLIIKLSYAFQDREKPHLEIFLNDDEAQSKEWAIYGTLLDETDDRFAKVRFGLIGEEQEFTIRSSRYRIQFDNFYREMHTDQNGAMERRYVYEFLVKAVP